MTRDFMVVTAPKQKQCPQNAPPGKGAAKGANITCTSRSLPTASDVGYDAEWYAPPFTQLALAFAWLLRTPSML
jgi:hypothetical protein